MSHRSSRNARSARSIAAHGHRFTSEQHAEALKLIAAGMKGAEVAASIGCTTESLRRWVKANRANGAVAKLDSKIEAASVGPSAVLSAPHDPGSGLGEHESKMILDYKRRHPSMGPAQIRAQLKRFLGWRVSVRAIARVLHKAGFPKVHRKGRPVGEEHPGRFEAPHRNSLWQLDFKELRIGAERRWLLVIEGDFSRFIVGHALAEDPTSEVVVAALREAIRLHGKCERAYTIGARRSPRGAT